MDYRGKHHKILQDLKQDLSRGFLESEISIRGFKFKLRTLTEDEETWSESYIRSTTPISMLTSRKAPKLAVAIREVNGVPRNELFSYPDDMPKEIVKALDENPIQKRYWYQEQMFCFLSEDSMRPFINELYDELIKLEERRDNAIKEIPN